MADTSKYKKSKYPNVYVTPSGGHYVRARVTDPATDKVVQIKKTHDTKDPLEALRWLQAETDRIRCGVPLVPSAKTRFSEFAAQLFENKVSVGDIKSAAGRTRWGSTLAHLIGGTQGDKAGKFVAGSATSSSIGLDASHVEAWKLAIAGHIKAGDYVPQRRTGGFRFLGSSARRPKGSSASLPWPRGTSTISTPTITSPIRRRSRTLFTLTKCLCSSNVFESSTRSTTP